LHIGAVVTSSPDREQAVAEAVVGSVDDEAGPEYAQQSANNVKLPVAVVDPDHPNETKSPFISVDCDCRPKSAKHSKLYRCAVVAVSNRNVFEVVAGCSDCGSIHKLKGQSISPPAVAAQATQIGRNL